MSYIQKYFPAFSLIAGGAILLLASFAVAAIVSGTFATNTSNNVTITQLTVAKPTSTADGELLLASITIKGGAAESITPPSGWTQILRTDNGNNTSMVTYSKFASTSEPVDYTWTITPQTRAIGSITRYSGVSASNPINAAAGASGTSATAIAPSITTSVDNTQIIAVYGFNAGAIAIGHFSTPVGMTEKYDITYTPQGPAMALDETILATTGTSGARSSTLGSSRNWVAQQIALTPKPSISVPTPVSYWKFDESSGDAADATGNGKTLTNPNSAIYAAGKINNGIDLERDTSQYLTRTNDGYDTPSGTVSCWIKIEENPLALWIVSDSTNAGSQGFDFRINEDNKVHLSFGDGATSVLGSTSLFPGTFYMVTGTWTPAGKQVFVNGLSDGVDANPATLTEGGGSIEIGGTAINPTQSFDGTIDECGIWDQELTNAQISELYNGGAGVTYPF